MINLKIETLEDLESYDKTLLDIDYVHIFKRGEYNEDHVDYEDYGNHSGYEIIDISSGDLDIMALDFEYDCGYGRQLVFGHIVFKDGTWLERSEYDGAEWWTCRSKPTRKCNF
tara:strand:+ start:853 stop:1191 length:339 start_codon:yes stop_codon:yes gene_type:complete